MLFDHVWSSSWNGHRHVESGVLFSESGRCHRHIFNKTKKPVGDGIDYRTRCWCCICWSMLKYSGTAGAQKDSTSSLRLRGHDVILLQVRGSLLGLGGRPRFAIHNSTWFLNISNWCNNISYMSSKWDYEMYMICIGRCHFIMLVFSSNSNGFVPTGLPQLFLGVSQGSQGQLCPFLWLVIVASCIMVETHRSYRYGIVLFAYLVCHTQFEPMLLIIIHHVVWSLWSYAEG